jgi:hypothetical protein
MCSTWRDEDRIVGIIEGEIEAGRVEKVKGWKGVKDVKGRKRRVKAGEKEEKELADEAGAQESGGGLVEAGWVGESKRKFDDVVAGLEENAAKKGRKGKKKVEMPSEEEFAALQAKMFEK